MKSTIKESIPDTVEGLELFIRECAKEINKYSKLQQMAQEDLDIKTGRLKPSWGIN